MKSFLLTVEIPCYSVSISYIDISEKIIISEVLPIIKFRKISFYEFANWFEWRIANDKKYNRKDQFCSFLFLFEKKIIEHLKVNLDELQPLFPWKSKFLLYFKKDEEEIDFLKKKIIYLEDQLNKRSTP